VSALRRVRCAGRVAACLCCLLILGPGSLAAAQIESAPTPPREQTLTLEAALDLAFEHNPDLQASALGIDAARARRTGASLLLPANPEVSTAAGPRMMDGGDSVEWGVALSQRVEIAGQRGARIEAADAGLRASQSQRIARGARLAADVREAFGQVVAADQMLAVAKEAELLAGDGLAAAAERHEAGDASLIEVNVARIEVGSAARLAASSRQARESALAALRVLLGVPGYLGLSPVGPLEPTGLCERGLDELLEAARSRRGDLLAARAEVERAQAERKLAEREAIVSPTIGIAYNREDDADIVQATISVPLPISDRNQVAKSEAGLRLTQARLSLQSMERTVTQEVELALARCRASREVLLSFQGEISRAAESNLALANEGYRAGKIDFLQLLLIRREALATRRAASESLQEWNAAEADMVRATGELAGASTGVRR
jgi:cobalt-zinc-cadmium efflux system outer membrane protein